MPTLLLSIPGQPSREINLERGPYRIGRDIDNDIVLESPVVSRKHGLLELRGEEWVYTDLDSRNGSLVNGQKIKQVILKEGVHLQLGKDARLGVIVTLKNAVTPLMPKQPQTPAKAAVETFVAAKESTTGLIELASVLPQGQKPLTLGRGAESDIHLPAPSVSRRHAVLHPAQPEWTLVDLNSANGTFVNGKRVSGPTVMKRGDTIQIGPFRLAYEGGGVVKVFAATRGLRLDGQALNVLVGTGAARKAILENVNISCYPQEFIGLVGGSGAGKTTLMKTMSGLLPPQGRVLIEGEDLYHNYDSFRSQIGYVPQDDILHKELTVEQALRYSARLRLPEDINDGEIESRVQKVLEQVELSGQRGQPIQSLSGGQRKRASIAVELLADPPLFFLDEPTSGLDPGLEKKMMVMLGKLADSGKTILLVTHATANITECDQVAFMSQGKMVFFGPPNQADQFFEVGANNFASIYDEISDPDPQKAKSRAASWEEKFKNSDFYKKYVRERVTTLPAPRGKRENSASRGTSGRRANPLTQFFVLTRRYFDLILRDKILLTILLAIMPLLAAYLLMITDQWWLVGDGARLEQILSAAINAGAESKTDTVAAHGQALIFMMALASVLLGLFAAAYEIVKERTVYARERMVFLQLVPYLASKVFMLSLFAAVQVLLFLIVLSFKIDFPTVGVILPAPIEIYITLVLGAVAAIMFGLLISAIAPNASSVSYIILGVMFIQILFAGVLFKLPGVSGTLSNLTLSRWTTEALGVSVNLEQLNADYSRTRFNLGPRTENVTVTVKQPADDWECVTVTQEMQNFPGCRNPIPVPVVKENELVEVEKKRTEPVDIDPDPETIQTPLEFTLNYERSAPHLLFAWAMLIGLSAVLGACTIFALKRQDTIS
jgi:ABC-type multidrug transport system ATPase subunit/pSer/pThr/pTyr-binding forkhead associated (FHA) protein